jgi:hypothetical protein
MTEHAICKRTIENQGRNPHLEWRRTIEEDEEIA